MKKIVVASLIASVAVGGFFVRAMAQNAPAAPPAAPPVTISAADTAQAVQDFNTTCAGCHGEGAGGGDRGPSLVGNAHLRTLDTDGITGIIRTGQRAMPPFPTLPAPEVARLAAWLHSMNISGLQAADPAQLASGERYFFGAGGCSGCHMVRGHGAPTGPDLSGIAARSTKDEMTKWLDDPTSMMGIKSLPSCPGWAFCPDFQWAIQNVVMKDGRKLRGFARRQTEHEVALQTLDGQFRMLYTPDIASITQSKISTMPVDHSTGDQRRDLLAYLGTLGGINPGPLTGDVAPVSQAEIDQVMHPKKGDWATYNGRRDGNHYSTLSQINTANVARLQPAWAFTPGGVGLEGEPTVVDGIMYLTGGPQTCALDARTGTRIWCTPRTNGVGVPVVQGPRPPRNSAAAPPPAGPNRGVAILGDRLFYTSDDAYIVCLNRLNGAVMWTEPLAEPSEKGHVYTSAQVLVVNDLVITGVAGGDGPMRGFIVAYHANTGKEAWRYYTIPKPGEPLSETWIGRALITGGGATWETGSYDAETQTLYWPIGNPYPDYDASERGGTNLDTNSVIALDVATGKKKWAYQFTPYDTHDWDATEPMVLVDTIWKGQPRKLLMTAQRSGVFYVLDRTTGEFLLAKPFAHKVSWADSFDPKTGAAHLLPGNTPTPEGTKTCPGVRGATNWYPSAWSPQTKLFYVMAAEDCGVYHSRNGRGGGANLLPASDPGTRLVRALNIETGDIVWEKLLTGPQETDYTGVLATAGGLVFHGEIGGDFAAVDAKTGKTLYTFPTNDSWRATPMTYLVDGRQYIAGMDGQVLWAFALGFKSDLGPATPDKPTSSDKPTVPAK